MIYGVNEHGERNKNKAVQTDDSDNDIETDNEREIDPMQRLAAEIKDAQEAVELASVEDIYQLVIILKFDEFDIIAGTQSTLTWCDVKGGNCNLLTHHKFINGFSLSRGHQINSR